MSTVGAACGRFSLGTLELEASEGEVARGSTATGAMMGVGGM